MFRVGMWIPGRIRFLFTTATEFPQSIPPNIPYPAVAKTVLLAAIYGINEKDIQAPGAKGYSSGRGERWHDECHRKHRIEDGQNVLRDDNNKKVKVKVRLTSDRTTQRASCTLRSASSSTKRFDPRISTVMVMPVVGTPVTLTI